MKPTTVTHAILALEHKDKNARVVGIQLKGTAELPIFRLVYRKAVQYYLAGTVKVLLKNDKPLINYVHAEDIAQANLFGFDMSSSIDHVFCYDETEEIRVQDVLV